MSRQILTSEMSFILKLYDRKGNELKEGDIVRIYNTDREGLYLTFYSEVKFLEDQQAIAPFHTFSFSEIEKADKLPDNIHPCTEERYRIWYVGNEDAEAGQKEHDAYLMEWRACEYLINKRMFRITRLETPKVEDVPVVSERQLNMFNS